MRKVQSLVLAVFLPLMMTVMTVATGSTILYFMDVGGWWFIGCSIGEAMIGVLAGVNLYWIVT